jgi:hypothetical protein
VRKGVNDDILLADNKRDPDEGLDKFYQEERQNVQSHPGNRAAKDLFQEFMVTPAYAPIQYAYTQLLLRHATLPGQDKGPPPTLLAIRKINGDSAAAIVGHEVNPTGKEQFTYHTGNALAAESWAIVSAVNGPENKIYGDSAIYGRVPIYSILTSFFSQSRSGLKNDGWSDAQKELVVMPFSDVELTIETKFDELAYTKEVVLPAMEQQYGTDNEAVITTKQRTETWRP